MTAKRDLKIIIRARQAKTGESYSIARRQVLAAKGGGQAMPEVSTAKAFKGDGWHPSIETTRAEAEAILKNALDIEPGLTRNGVGIHGESKRRAKAARAGNTVQELDDEFIRERLELHNHLDEIAASADWIKRQTRIKTFNTHTTSYGYKHAVERWFKDRPGPYVYVANGSFIAAALGLGYPLKQADPTSPNVYFQFSRRSVRTPNDSAMTCGLSSSFQSPASEMPLSAGEVGRGPFDRNQILLNLICAGVNDLVDRKLIDLNALEDSEGRLDTALFGKPARVLWRGVGFGQLAITVWWHVKPGCSEENTQRPLAKQIGRAVDACCTAWLEREKGKGIMVHKDGGLAKVDAYLSRTAQDYLGQQPEIIPNGYSRAGQFFY